MLIKVKRAQKTARNFIILSILSEKIELNYFTIFLMSLM